MHLNLLSLQTTYGIKRICACEIVEERSNKTVFRIVRSSKDGGFKSVDFEAPTSEASTACAHICIAQCHAIPPPLPRVPSPATSSSSSSPPFLFLLLDCMHLSSHTTWLGIVTVLYTHSPCRGDCPEIGSNSGRTQHSSQGRIQIKERIKEQLNQSQSQIHDTLYVVLLFVWQQCSFIRSVSCGG